MYVVQVLMKYSSKNKKNSVSWSLCRFIWGVTIHVSHCFVVYVYRQSRLRLYGQQRKETPASDKKQTNKKELFYPHLPDRCLGFLHRIMKRGLLCRHQILCEDALYCTAETIQQVVYKLKKMKCGSSKPNRVTVHANGGL